MGYTIFMNIAAKKFSRPREDGSAGGGCGEECRAVRAFRRAKRGGYVRFRFLDLCIRFGKIISKVCDGFNSGAKKLDMNSDFGERENPAPPQAGLGVCLPARQGRIALKKRNLH